MRANQVRNLLLIAVTGAALTLAGCGGRSVSSVDENDSTISSIASAVSEDTMSTDTLDGNGVIAAQEIDPSAVTPAAGSDSTTSSDSSASSTTSSAAESTATEESTGYTTAGVNMRSDADTDSDVVNTIEYGEEVTVLGTKDGWTHVRYDGEEGYVKSTYISSTQPSSNDDDSDYDSSDNSSDDEDYSSEDNSSDDEDSSESSSDDEDTESSSDEDTESSSDEDAE